MTLLYLTLFKDGHTLPDGLMVDLSKYHSPHHCTDEGSGFGHVEEGCEDCAEDNETRARLVMLCEAMQGMGYEVSFTREPHTSEPDLRRSVIYEEVS